MWIALRLLSSTKSSSILSLLLLTAYIHPAFSIPHILSSRQSTFSNLQLPSCALTCFLNGILSDGCANETDFICHCTSGDIISKAKPCIVQGCDDADEADAFGKVQIACRAYSGGSSGRNAGVGNGDASSRVGSSTRTVLSAAPISRTTLSTLSQPSVSSSGSDSRRAAATTPPTSSTAPSSGNTHPTSTIPLPTDMPLALLPPSDQLSDGAKAGISVSVSFFALSIFFALGWYIRRLKRELKAAQRAAGIPSDIWASSIATAAAPGGVARANSGRGRTLMRNGRESPVSPLSPRMEEVITITDNGYGVLKKKRGHVLSVVVEREEEGDGNSLDRMIREPVPGQREGLAGPLELDGEGTGVWEMPIAITPRERSVER